MLLHSESAVLPAPAEQVWRILVDPTRTVEWNDQIVTVQAESGTVGRGYRYRAVYHLRDVETTLVAEYETFEPPHTLGIHLEGESLGEGESIGETYVLEPVIGGTRVTHEVTLHGRTSRIAALLVKLLARARRSDDVSQALTKLGDVVVASRP